MSTLAKERQTQDQAGLRDYAKLAAAAFDDVSHGGNLSSENLDELILLLGESAIYADEALYDFFANIWSLPEAFTDIQIEILVATLVDASFDDISRNNVYIVSDFIMKTVGPDRLTALIERLSHKKNGILIVDFIESSNKLGIGNWRLR